MVDLEGQAIVAMARRGPGVHPNPPTQRSNGRLGQQDGAPVSDREPIPSASAPWALPNATSNLANEDPSSRSAATTCPPASRTTMVSALKPISLPLERAPAMMFRAVCRSMVTATPGCLFLCGAAERTGRPEVSDVPARVHPLPPVGSGRAGGVVVTPSVSV